MSMDLDVIRSEEVVCDLCGATGSVPLYRVRDTLYHLPGEYILRRCEQCGLIYLSPRPIQQSIGHYYPEDYASYHRPIEDERIPLMRWMRRRKLQKRRDLIEKYGGCLPGCILDVGSSTGLFLNEMQHAGWKVSGIEPIESAAAFARERFELDVFRGMLSEATYDRGSFDVVTFWDVLEHTFSPRAEIAQAAQLLRSGGLLLISVPNWSSWERRWFGRHWQGFDPPRHLYVFTPTTLDCFLQEAGFVVLDRVCIMPSYFSAIISLERWLRDQHPSWAPRIRRVAHVPGMRLLFEPLFGLANRLRKGSVITLVARKVEI
jgi:SAM-dependent methyltransferase